MAGADHIEKIPTTATYAEKMKIISGAMAVNETLKALAATFDDMGMRSNSKAILAGIGGDAWLNALRARFTPGPDHFHPHSPQHPSRVAAAAIEAMQIDIANHRLDNTPGVGRVATNAEALQHHPALDSRGGVDPSDPDYFSQLAETRGD